MLRVFLVKCFLLFISVFVFSSESVPEKIIVQINNDTSYQIQIGAYKRMENADKMFSFLKSKGFTVNYEKFKNFTRVKIIDVKANQIQSYLKKLKNLGIDEVIIREGKNSNILSEKWEIISPSSNYSSFEFNQDGNYIVVENNSEKTVHFGDYKMVSKNIYDLIDLGVLKVKDNNGKDIDFSFSSIDQPEKEINFKAEKSEIMSESLKTNLFTRSWKLVETTNNINATIGDILFVSDAGTYLFVDSSGEHKQLSRWRWYDEKNNLWEYSHDNGITWYKIRETNLRKDMYTLVDDPNYFYKFVPAR